MAWAERVRVTGALRGLVILKYAIVFLLPRRAGVGSGFVSVGLGGRGGGPGLPRTRLPDHGRAERHCEPELAVVRLQGHPEPLADEVIDTESGAVELETGEYTHRVG